MQKPILIIGAMESEVDYLISKLENVKKNKLNIYKVYEGNIENYPVVIALCQVGIINATSLTTLAIEKYNPLLIINEGTAGGYGKKIHKGDIVIGTECFNITSVKTPYKDEKEGSNSLEWKYVTFASDETDKMKTIKGDRRLIEFIENQNIKNESGRVIKGIIGSGDVWNCEKDKIMYLNKNYNIVCEEMEGIAVYQVAENYDIPKIGIRVISNNEVLEEKYEKGLAKKCQEYVYEIIKKIIENKGGIK